MLEQMMWHWVNVGSDNVETTLKCCDNVVSEFNNGDLALLMWSR